MAAIPHLNDALVREPSEVRNAYGLAQCYYNLAFAHAGSGDTQQANDDWRKSLNYWRALMYMRPRSSDGHSRAAATLSNLAMLARQVEDFQRCRELADEALGWQKRALALEPVYELAHDFLKKHYHELAWALTALKEREALIVAASSTFRISIC